MGTTSDNRMRLRRIPTRDLTASEITIIRGLLVTAFGSDEEEGFDDDDWAHALGGVHFVLEVNGVIVSHAAVVERELHVGGKPVRTGYVEAVATAADRQGAGFGSMVMADVTSYIRERFELGALGTGRQLFYQRLGWQVWEGQAFVRTADGPRRTPDEEGYILVLPTPSSPPIDLTASISCDWRPGDDW
jgi:aminoglycoside 2'-N-acetyltransferase I